MKKSQILDFFIIYFSLSIGKISSKSETWSPEAVRFGIEHIIYMFCLKMFYNFLLTFFKMFIV